MENISGFRPKPNFPRQHFDQCVASLSVSSAMACAGEILDGRFSIQVRQDFKVRGVWVELECWERAGAKTAKTIRDSVLLLAGERLTASQVLEWPFQMQVPKNSLPSTALQDTQVVWLARGILDVGRIKQRNLEVQQQIQVYIDPSTFSLSLSSGSAVPSLGQQCLWCGHRYRHHIDTSLNPSLGREPNRCSVVYCPCQEFSVGPLTGQ